MGPTPESKIRYVRKLDLDVACGKERSIRTPVVYIFMFKSTGDVNCIHWYWCCSRSCLFSVSVGGASIRAADEKHGHQTHAQRGRHPHVSDEKNATRALLLLSSCWLPAQLKRYPTMKDSLRCIDFFPLFHINVFFIDFGCCSWWHR